MRKLIVVAISTLAIGLASGASAAPATLDQPDSLWLEVPSGSLFDSVWVWVPTTTAGDSVHLHAARGGSDHAAAFVARGQHAVIRTEAGATVNECLGFMPPKANFAINARTCDELPFPAHPDSNAFTVTQQPSLPGAPVWALIALAIALGLGGVWAIRRTAVRLRA